MAALGVGVSRIPDELPPIVMSLLTGLNAAAVGLIALAAVQLGTAASTDKITTLIVWLSASFGVCYHHPAMYPSLIAAGGITTLSWDFRRQLFIRPYNRSFRKGVSQDQDGPDEMELERVTNVPVEIAARPSSGMVAEEMDKDIATVRPHSYPSPAPSPTRVNMQLPNQDIEPATQPTPSLRSRRTASNLVSEERQDRQNEQYSPLQTVPKRAALCLLAAFCLLLIVPLSARAGIKNAGKVVPRSLDVSYTKQTLS